MNGIVLCIFEQDETIYHLFISCKFANQVWCGINSWLRLLQCSSLIWMEKFQHFGSLSQSKRVKKATHLICLASLWCIWMEINITLFRGAITRLSMTLSKIKSIFWGWFVSNLGRSLGLTIEDRWIRPNVCIQAM